MKKLSLTVLASLVLAACTASSYSEKGNATVIASKPLSNDVVELTVQRDSGETVKLTREYNAHVAVGARIYLADRISNQDSDIKTIKRYEFK